MNVELKELTTVEEALRLAPLFDQAAAWSMAEFRDVPVPAGVAERFFARHLGASECLVLVAEDVSDADRDPARPLGMCVTAPLEDPLLLEKVPLVAVLFVDPGVRHRGVAGELVRRARELLAERGHPALAARAGHNDDALISMGERWGFTRAWELMVIE